MGHFSGGWDDELAFAGGGKAGAEEGLAGAGAGAATGGAGNIACG